VSRFPWEGGDVLLDTRIVIWTRKTFQRLWTALKFRGAKVSGRGFLWIQELVIDEANLSEAKAALKFSGIQVQGGRSSPDTETGYGRFQSLGGGGGGGSLLFGAVILSGNLPVVIRYKYSGRYS
jgi:hypothetical protein